MSILSSLILKEYERNSNMLNEYENILAKLPKGSLVKKRIKGQEYFYLSFRDGNKVISKYIGKDEEKINTIKDQLIRRKQIEYIVKKLKEEKEKITKMEEIL